MDYSQYLAQISYSALVPRNLKSTSTMSWNPSLSFGSLNRDVKPVKASFGRGCLSSGLSCGMSVGGRVCIEHLRVTHLFVQGSDSIVMLAQLDRRPEPDTSCWNFVLVSQCHPLRSSIWVGVCSIWADQ